MCTESISFCLFGCGLVVAKFGFWFGRFLYLSIFGFDWCVFLQFFQFRTVFLFLSSSFKLFQNMFFAECILSCLLRVYFFSVYFLCGLSFQKWNWILWILVFEDFLSDISSRFLCFELFILFNFLWLHFFYLLWWLHFEDFRSNLCWRLSSSETTNRSTSMSLWLDIIQSLFHSLLLGCFLFLFFLWKLLTWFLFIQILCKLLNLF